MTAVWGRTDDGRKTLVPAGSPREAALSRKDVLLRTKPVVPEPRFLWSSSPCIKQT